MDYINHISNKKATKRKRDSDNDDIYDDKELKEDKDSKVKKNIYNNKNNNIINIHEEPIENYDDENVNRNNIHEEPIENYDDENVNRNNSQLINVQNNPIPNILTDQNHINNENPIQVDNNNNIENEQNNNNNENPIQVDNNNNIENEQNNNNNENHIQIDNNNNIENEQNNINNPNPNFNIDNLLVYNNNAHFPISRRYQVFMKPAKTYYDQYDDNGDKPIQEYFATFLNRHNATLERISWNLYRIPNNRYFSYICIVYKPLGSKTYDTQIPTGFIYQPKLNETHIPIIDLGDFHPNKVEHTKQIRYKGDTTKKNYERKLKNLGGH